MIVLYFDVETTGLDLITDKITVISVIVENTETGEISKNTFNVIVETEAGNEENLRRRIYNLFDECDRISGYNNLSFDNVWLAHWLSPCLGASIASRWARKTIDFYQTAHALLHVKIGLSKILKDNGIEMQKSGTGLLAIQWARERNFRDLEDYCMQDVEVLFKLTQLARNKFVVAKGYHPKDPAQAPCRYFRLDAQMQTVIVDAHGEDVEPPPPRLAKRARVCEDYGRNVETMLEGGVSVNANAFSRLATCTGLL